MYPTLETQLGPLVIQKKSLQVGERVSVETEYSQKPGEKLFLEVYRGGESGWVQVEGEKELRLKVGLVPDEIRVTKGMHLLQKRIITK